MNTKDAAVTGDILVNMCTTPLVRGFMNYQPYYRLKENTYLLHLEKIHTIDKLLALSEALGCTGIQDPEQGRWGYGEVDPDTLLQDISSAVDFDVSAPIGGGGTFGVVSKFGVHSMRDLTAIYVAHRTKSILSDMGRSSVAEIGGGIGSLAYYAAKSGVKEISVYDIPTVSIVQGYFLMRGLGQEMVGLAGEADAEKKQVVVRPCWHFGSLHPKQHALVVNHDSLPEIEISVALGYLDQMKAMRAKLFLSINQEAQDHNAFGGTQSVVGRLVEQSGGFERTCRFPYWMRPGYVEELFQLSINT